jgi:ubiquinone/menaquinone biosynthesis C-methylase UbiE
MVAPFVAEVVAVEPEPGMLSEGERRAQAIGIGNVQCVAASWDDLPMLRSSLGRFRAALMGNSFHWMTEKDRVLQDLGAMIDKADGSIAFVGAQRTSTPDALKAVRSAVREILERFLADVPRGPHPRGRHEPFEDILARNGG